MSMPLPSPTRRSAVASITTPAESGGLALGTNAGVLLACLLTCLVGMGACDDGPTNGPGPGPIVETGPTYYGEVRSILEENCYTCHAEGGVGPFELTTYDAVKPLSGLIVSATHARTMPPWGAFDTDECKPRFAFKDDLSLTPGELETLQLWHDNGAPMGDASLAPAGKADAAPVADLYTLKNPTGQLLPKSPFVTEGLDDQFRCFVLDPKLTEQHWLTGLQFVPGNPVVTHHALLFLDTSGESLTKMDADGGYTCFGGPDVDPTVLVGAWAPGGVPTNLPAGAAMSIPAGAVFVMQVHYHPTGLGAEQDLTAVDIRMTTEVPEWRAETALIGNFPEGFGDTDGLLPGPNDPTADAEFLIPADADSHVETMSVEVPYVLNGAPYPGAYLYSVFNHMHYVGVDMKVTIDRKEQGPPTCAAQQTTDLILCGEAHCSDAPDLLTCMLGSCNLEFEALGSECTSCLVTNSSDPNVIAMCAANGFAPHQDYPAIPEQPDSECLIQTPQWNFEWQRQYVYDVPIEQLPFVSAGDRLTMRCTYNNTTSNPFVQASLKSQGLTAPHDIVLGDETLDEMCLWGTIYLYKNYR